MTDQSPVTVDFFFKELKKKVSDSNAKILLHSAVVRSGISCAATDAPLEKNDARALCTALMRSGGPGFQVGRAVYNACVR